MSIESFIQSVIEGKKKCPGLKSVLYWISRCFACLVNMRHRLYDSGVLKTYEVFLPVISVGNIVVGGSGKTPFVKKMIQELGGLPGSIAILSRGYRAKKTRDTLQVSSGFGSKVSSFQAGDEPYLLAQNTNAAVWIGKDRVKSAELAKKKGAHLLILDDGFQHRRLKRDLDIVLLHAKDPWGQGYFLPRGYLREGIDRLKKADFLVVTYMQEPMQDLVNTLQALSAAPIIGLKAIYMLEEKVKGKKIGAFCGLARPDFFYEALKKEAEIVDVCTAKDHFLPSREQLQLFSRKCQEKGAEYLVCTEKDLVKLPSNLCLSLPIVVLKMDFTCVWNEKAWQEMILKVQNVKGTFCRENCL